MSSSCITAAQNNKAREFITHDDVFPGDDAREGHDVSQLKNYKHKDRRQQRGLYESDQFPYYLEALAGALSLGDLLDGCADIAAEYTAILENFCETLTISRTAEDMLFEAAEDGWAIALADLGKDGDFFIDVPQKVMLISHFGMSEKALRASPYFGHCMQMNMVRALRDIWHEKRSGAFEKTYGLDDVLMLERVRAADLEVIAVLSAWEIRCEGMNDEAGNLWRHMIGSENGDMALAFSNVLQAYVLDEDQGLCDALWAAFQSWFGGDTRINDVDHETLEHLDMMVQESDGEPVRLGAKRLIAQGVEILSCLPDRRAYLRGKGGEILSAPRFAGLESEINQSHYFQLRRDLGSVLVNNVAFRDQSLAAKIFPREFTGICY